MFSLAHFLSKRKKTEGMERGKGVEMAREVHRYCHLSCLFLLLVLECGA
jgi:hypothetical protein